MTRNIIKYLVTIIEETLRWLAINKYHIKGKHSAVITTDPPQLNNSVLRGEQAPNQEIDFTLTVLEADRSIMT